MLHLDEGTVHAWLDGELSAGRRRERRATRCDVRGMPNARRGSARAHGRRIADRVGARRGASGCDPASAAWAELQSANVASIRADADADVDCGDDRRRRGRDDHRASRRRQQRGARAADRQSHQRDHASVAGPSAESVSARVVGRPTGKLKAPARTPSPIASANVDMSPSKPAASPAAQVSEATVAQKAAAGGQAGRDRSAKATRRCRAGPCRVAAACRSSGLAAREGRDGEGRRGFPVDCAGGRTASGVLRWQRQPAQRNRHQRARCGADECCCIAGVLPTGRRLDELARRPAVRLCARPPEFRPSRSGAGCGCRRWRRCRTGRRSESGGAAGEHAPSILLSGETQSGPRAGPERARRFARHRILVRRSRGHDRRPLCVGRP